MSNPEVEVRTFKQQGGESLKDAWYRISNSHHKCTEKHSTMILIRNFYVGITSWNRYILDTLTGGNFLGTPALEACTLIESLVEVPPIHVVCLSCHFDVGLFHVIGQEVPHWRFSMIHIYLQ
jgi:hypothetical protein